MIITINTDDALSPAARVALVSLLDILASELNDSPAPAPAPALTPVPDDLERAADDAIELADAGKRPSTVVDIPVDDEPEPKPKAKAKRGARAEGGSVVYGVRIPARARSREHRAALEDWRAAYDALPEDAAESVMRAYVPAGPVRHAMAGDLDLMRRVTAELRAARRDAVGLHVVSDDEDEDEPTPADEPTLMETMEAAPTPDEDEDENAGAVIAQAVSMAREALTSGRADDVRDALLSVGGTKVSELSLEQAKKFVAELIDSDAAEVDEGDSEFIQWAQEALGRGKSSEVRAALERYGFKSVFDVTKKIGAQIRREIDGDE